MVTADAESIAAAVQVTDSPTRRRPAGLDLAVADSAGEPCLSPFRSQAALAISASSEPCPSPPRSPRSTELGGISEPLAPTLLCLACLSTIQISVCIFCIVVNGGFESIRNNPLLGPSGSTLYICGALVPKAGQHWRLLSSALMSAGLVHLLPVLLLQRYIVIPFESQWGFWHSLEVVLVSCISGSLLCAAFGDGSQLTVGLLNPLCGQAAARLLSCPGSPYAGKGQGAGSAAARLHWKITAFFLLGLLLLSVFTPFLDLYGHLGGMLGGLAVSSMQLAPWPSEQRCEASVLRVLSVIGALSMWSCSIVLISTCTNCNEQPRILDLESVSI